MTMDQVERQLRAALKIQKEATKACESADKEVSEARLSVAKIYLQAVKDFNASTDEFYIWKKAYYYRSNDKWGRRIPCIVKLRVTSNSLRILEFSEHDIEMEELNTANQFLKAMNSSKLRVSEAVVVSITDIKGRRNILDKVFSQHDPWFYYAVGDTVKPVEPFDRTVDANCVSGIYGLLSRDLAERY